MAKLMKRRGAYKVNWDDFNHACPACEAEVNGPHEGDGFWTCATCGQVNNVTDPSTFTTLTDEAQERLYRENVLRFAPRGDECVF